jgi:ubiquinone/menaquinone biosynthesis C-methylase UbiE
MTTLDLPSPAEQYETFFGPGIFDPLSAILIERAAPQAGERVLDMACGDGIVRFPMPTHPAVAFA